MNHSWYTPSDVFPARNTVIINVSGGTWSQEFFSCTSAFAFVRCLADFESIHKKTMFVSDYSQVRAGYIHYTAIRRSLTLFGNFFNFKAPLKLFLLSTSLTSLSAKITKIYSNYGTNKIENQNSLKI